MPPVFSVTLLRFVTPLVAKSPPVFTVTVRATVPSESIFWNSTVPALMITFPAAPAFAPASVSTPVPVFVKSPVLASCPAARLTFESAPAPGDTCTAPPAAPTVRIFPAAKFNCWLPAGLWMKLPPASVTFAGKFSVAALCAFCSAAVAATVMSPVPRAPTSFTVSVPPFTAVVPVRVLAAPSVSTPAPSFVSAFAFATSPVLSVSVVAGSTSTVPPAAPSVSARAEVKVPVARSLPPSRVMPFAAPPRLPSAETVSLPAVTVTPPVNEFTPARISSPRPAFASPAVPAIVAVIVSESATFVTVIVGVVPASVSASAATKPWIL